MLLKNKNIFVTGAGKGIGFATVLEAIKQGAFVYALVKSKKDKHKFKKLDNIKVFYGDVTNHKIIKKILSSSIKEKKLISGLVNNAGIRQRLNFLTIKKNNLKKVFDINFFSVFYLMQIFSKYFIKYKIEGSIVNIGSIVGKVGFSQLSGYASTKSALSGLTKSFAVEMAKVKIRANLINPGFVKTSYFKKFKKKKRLYDWTLSRVPLGRWGEAFEVSHLVCFLLSENAAYITAEEINIDGGWLGA
jgi:3-oxoacyl-[acyl-carrier protein] reductase